MAYPVGARAAGTPAVGTVDQLAPPSLETRTPPAVQTASVAGLPGAATRPLLGWIQSGVKVPRSAHVAGGEADAVAVALADVDAEAVALAEVEAEAVALDDGVAALVDVGVVVAEAVDVLDGWLGAACPQAASSRPATTRLGRSRR